MNKSEQFLYMPTFTVILIGVILFMVKSSFKVGIWETGVFIHSQQFEDKLLDLMEETEIFSHIFNAAVWITLIIGIIRVI